MRLTKDLSKQHSRSLMSISSSAIQKRPYVPQRRHSLIVWVALIGLLFPAILFSVGGVNLTPGRFVVILLLVPAIILLLKVDRKSVASDFFATALAIWVLASSVLNGGFKPYVAAEALELLGAYLIGRAFVFGPSQLRTFIGTLQQITIVIVALALLDTLSGRHVTLDSFGIETPLSRSISQQNYRLGLVRASSVFEGAEHYGTFCVAAASIFLYSERGIRQILYVGISLLGCALALSSGPLMGMAVVAGMFAYDRILQRYSWRWKLLVTTVLSFLLLIFVTSDHPIEWILVHMTLDSETGFFRIGTWNAAIPLIKSSPFVGYGLSALGDTPEAQLYLSSVDCLWLVEALRYGIPAVILLILTMFSPLLKKTQIFAPDPNFHNIQTGFTLAIVAIGLIGVSVHFWDAPWLFFNLCVGIRASLAEYGARRENMMRQRKSAASPRT